MITVTEDKWEDFKAYVCDEICYYAVVSHDQDVLDLHCADCPLNNFESVAYPLGYCPHQE